MGIYRELTEFLPLTEKEGFFDWLEDYEYETHCVRYERPIHENDSYERFRNEYRNFIRKVHAYVDAYPELQLKQYQEVLQSVGIEWGMKSMRETEVSYLDEKGVMALLVGAVRADRFCEGALIEFFQNGCIRRWLLRLKELDESQSKPGKP